VSANYDHKRTLSFAKQPTMCKRLTNSESANREKPALWSRGSVAVLDSTIGYDILTWVVLYSTVNVTRQA
jgi:hypothetical protein